MISDGESSHELDGDYAPRGALRLMFARTFGGFFWGKLVSSGGMWIHSIVAAIVIFDNTRSTLMVGLVSVVQFGPQLFLSPLSGTWADRGRAAGQILTGRVVCGVGSGSLALWLRFTPAATGTTAAVPVLISSLLVGVGFVIGGPAMQSIIPNIIRRGELPTAMALNTVPMTTGRVAGPALGALVAANLGPATAFAIAATTQAVFVLILVVIRLPHGDSVRAGTDYSVRAALKYVSRSRPIAVVLLACCAAGVGSEPSMTLAPAMSHELGGGTQLVGELSATFGIGAVIGLAVISIATRHISLVFACSTGLWAMAVGLGIVAFSPDAWTAFTGFGVAGFGFAWAMTSISTLIQEQSPSHLRGRIMAFWLVAFIGSRPLAAVLVGWVADVSSVRASFMITGALLVLVALTCRPSRIHRPLRHCR